ncbi:hypothetical protein [Paraburkholderia acidisoli]|uniref:Uncharacterized protein n=1 Tax=Paraburkholderia acidisoli TaxID=2571748 RepID=A0A7Z2GS57_9BURK|nr:hypothetical protein [Paraburkholderia acidisoli]QGZ66977.1 hypothetical protein FAZ98_34650 [Paraburkholderia acidisoli]
MDDLAWMVRESAAAWLRGHGDARFPGYEAFYRDAWRAGTDNFDLEKLNEDYAKWVSERPSRLAIGLNRPIVGQALIGVLAAWIGAHTVPIAAGMAPKATAGLLVATFVALRIFHRKRRRRG